MDVGWYLRIIVNPGYVRISGRIDAVISDNRYLSLFSNSHDSLMEPGGKGMCSINYEPYLMLFTEPVHRLCVECPIDTMTMMKCQLLFTCLGAVEIFRPRLLKHLCCLPALCCSSEYQYHSCGM